MKKLIIFLAIFLYADISNVLLKIDAIENYKPIFKKINIPKCNKIVESNNKLTNAININNNLQLTLQAIFNKQVLINNRWLRENDFINGYKIVKIYKKRVVLKMNNKFVILRFNTNILKVRK